MFFASEPKIKHVARHLQSQLAEYYQDRWSHLLVVADKTENSIAINTGFNPTIISVENIPSSWFRTKEDFSWQMAIEGSNRDPYYNIQAEFENASLQTIHYRKLLEQANAIVDAVNQTQPNYARIIQLTNQIKNQSTMVPSVFGIALIEIKIGYFSGGNLLIDFFSGIGGLVYAPLMALASVLAIPFYCINQSHYCGSPAFFLDTATYFCNSLYKVISSVFFPLAMLRSKYDTDSYNPLKGELMRSLDSLVYLAEKVQQEESQTLTTSYLPQLTTSSSQVL